MTRQFFLLLLLSVLLSKNAFTQTGKLQLEINILPELKVYLNNAEISIHLLGDSNINRFISTTAKKMLFDSVEKGNVIILLDARIKIQGFQRVYRFSRSVFPIQNDSTTVVKLTFPENCKFNLHSISNICPKCKKRDKVLPITYGLPIPLIDENGNQVKEQPSVSGGCVVSNCDPSWYCKRDRLNF